MFDLKYYDEIRAKEQWLEEFICDGYSRKNEAKNRIVFRNMFEKTKRRDLPEYLSWVDNKDLFKI